jgi:hypothetical protein
MKLLTILLIILTTSAVVTTEAVKDDLKRVKRSFEVDIPYIAQCKFIECTAMLVKIFPMRCVHDALYM